MRVGKEGGGGRDVFLSLCLGFSLFSDFHVTACRSGLSDASQILKRQSGFPPPTIYYFNDYQI